MDTKRITKVKIELQHSDGYYTNVEVVVPEKVADKLATDALDWDSQWIASVREIREFLDTVDEVDWADVKLKREEN